VNRRTARTAPVDRSPRGISGLDPAVFDFRMSRRRAHEDHVLGMSLCPRDRFGHVRHERCLVRYQVIGREECNDRVRIVSDDPASRVENSGGRPAIERLGQDGRADRGRELFVDVAGVAAGRDHHRAYASDHEGDSVQGLSKKGTLAELRHILLGPITSWDAGKATVLTVSARDLALDPSFTAKPSASMCLTTGRRTAEGLARLDLRFQRDRSRNERTVDLGLSQAGQEV
jgi:hypothetical protein